MPHGRLEAYLASSKVSPPPAWRPCLGSLLWHFRFTNRSSGLEGHCRLQVWVQVWMQVQEQVQVQFQVQFKVKFQVQVQVQVQVQYKDQVSVG